ncbi:MAG TPA: PPK2 family polyphosphate kinase [Chloroflexota bacterium]|nr:PPK2 family polyphosphate kinase [Chloroflexota bacterium]
MTSSPHELRAPYTIKLTGQPVSLADIPPRQDGGFTKKTAKPRLKELNERLHTLQEALYAANRRSVLILLQGTDTAGKGGTIEHVMGGVDPAGCHVIGFKRPTELDLAHDFLWRVHPHAPAQGMISIFDRSHYEDVLIVRVHDLVPPGVWQARYEHINAFEKLLADSGTIILKFFLHISMEEQAERLKAREEEEDKRWKLNPGDYEERKRWDDYEQAYEAMLTRCATEYAPWYVVPADRKWFRNLAVAETIVDVLGRHETEWCDALLERGRKNYEALKKELRGS